MLWVQLEEAVQKHGAIIAFMQSLTGTERAPETVLCSLYQRNSSVLCRDLDCERARGDAFPWLHFGKCFQGCVSRAVQGCAVFQHGRFHWYNSWPLPPCRSGILYICILGRQVPRATTVDNNSRFVSFASYSHCKLTAVKDLNSHQRIQII